MAITNPNLLDGWDENGTNQGTPAAALITDGYVFQSIPKSSDTNRYLKELYRAVHFGKETGIWQWDNAVSYSKFARIMRNGRIYSSKADANQGNDPLSTSSWESAVFTGQKNLILNSRKSIDQRASGGGGKIQVIEANMNVGGNHALSFTGTATATVYEFPALLADYATTIADGSTNTLASGVASDTAVVSTAGYYIAVEFSTTDFDNIQLEIGLIATDLEIRHNELDLCLPFYERFDFPTTSEISLINWFTTTSGIVGGFSISRKRKVPTSALSSTAHFEGRNSTGTVLPFTSITISSVDLNTLVFSVALSGTTTAGNVGRLRAINAAAWLEVDAEIFNTTATYKEDRWFI